MNIFGISRSFKFIKSPLAFSTIFSASLGLSTSTLAISLNTVTKSPLIESIPTKTQSEVPQTQQLQAYVSTLEKANEDNLLAACSESNIIGHSEETTEPLTQEKPKYIASIEPSSMNSAVESTSSTSIDSDVAQGELISEWCSAAPVGMMVGASSASSFKPLAATPLAATGFLIDSSNSEKSTIDSASEAILASSSSTPKTAIATLASTLDSGAILPTSGISLSEKSPVALSKIPQPSFSSVLLSDVEKVPEPITLLGTGFALGAGFMLERKRKQNR